MVVLGVQQAEMAADLTQSMESINGEAVGNRNIAGQLGVEAGKFKLN